MAECRGLLEAVCRHRCAWPFLEEASRLCPGYQRRVPRPIDLGTAMARLKAGAYLNPQQLRREISHVWRNCLAYNERESSIARAAVALHEVFIDVWQVPNTRQL